MNYKDDIKAIAFDFDGTLIDYNYKHTKYTELALEKLAHSKYKICLSSGRPCFLAKRAFENYFGEYPLDYIFGCNGSEMMDCKTNELTILYPLKADEVRNLAKLLDVNYLMLAVYDGTNFLVNHLYENESTKAWLDARWLKPIVYDFEKNDIERSKAILINDPKDREIEKEFLSHIDLSDYSCAFSSNNCFEIAPKGVSKAKAIETLAHIINCRTEQILSFGDMENDMPMLLNSTGVIMDNARDELKAQIKLHTSAVDKMGVYDFLSRNQLI